jgi:hypothetical protein
MSHPRRALHPHPGALPAGLGRGLARHHPPGPAGQETGIFPVFEAERGEVTASRQIRRQVPVEDYLRPQKRFAHLFGTGDYEQAWRKLVEDNPFPAIMGRVCYHTCEGACNRAQDR